jgi:cytochrome c556
MDWRYGARYALHNSSENRDMKHNNAKANKTSLVLLALLGSGLALAQESSVTDTIQARQKGFKAMGAAFKTVRDETQAGSPDAEKIRTAAVDIKTTADQISKWFPAGSGPEAGVKTAAKPEIWSDAQGFDTARSHLIEQAGTFSELAAAGKVDGDAVRTLGRACGGCHEKFRVKQD